MLSTLSVTVRRPSSLRQLTLSVTPETLLPTLETLAGEGVQLDPKTVRKELLRRPRRLRAFECDLSGKASGVALCLNRSPSRDEVWGMFNELEAVDWSWLDLAREKAAVETEREWDLLVGEDDASEDASEGGDASEDDEQPRLVRSR